jgi:hypothetical protein
MASKFPEREPDSSRRIDEQPKNASMNDTQSFVQLLLVVSAVLITTRLLAVLAVKLGQPAILG